MILLPLFLIATLILWMCWVAFDRFRADTSKIVGSLNVKAAILLVLIIGGLALSYAAGDAIFAYGGEGLAVAAGVAYVAVLVAFIARAL